MADASKYLNQGIAGSMGDRASSDNNTFVQAGPAVDIRKLATELALVRAEMKKKAAPDDATHDAAIGTIAQAESAAKAGDKSKALELLKGAGKWTLDVAKS